VAKRWTLYPCSLAAEPGWQSEACIVENDGAADCPCAKDAMEVIPAPFPGEVTVTLRDDELELLEWCVRKHKGVPGSMSDALHEKLLAALGGFEDG
jgi:hypothetical protein